MKDLLIPFKILFMASLNVFLACLITDVFFLETIYNKFVQPEGWFEWTLRISGWVVASGILLLCSFGLNRMLFLLLFRSSQLFQKRRTNHLDKVMAYIKLRNPNHVNEANFPNNPATCNWIVQNGIPVFAMEVLLIKYISLYFDQKDTQSK
ncbi:hypothetical protein [Spirosoma pomorum]